MGRFMPAARAKFQQRLDYVYTLFPRLKERRLQLAGTMSGGEQQMCAIARA
jgi:branched-chain amino acid transport system ATP-binding protein